MAVFSAIGITLAVFLGFLLLIKQGARHSDRWLAAWFFTLSLHAYYLISVAEMSGTPSWISMIAHPMFLLYGPLMLAYITQITSHNRLNLWHFLPYISLVLILFGVHQFGPVYGSIVEFKGRMLITSYQQKSWLFYLLNFALLPYLFYPIYSLKLLSQHRTKIENSYSDISKVELSWIRWWIYSTLAGVMCTVFIILLPNRWFSQEVIGGIIFSSINLQMLYVGIKGLKQTRIFVAERTEGESGFDKSHHPGSLNKQSSEPLAEISNSQTEEIETFQASIIQLTEYVDSSQVFLESSLMSEQLAIQLGWKMEHLTKVLNQGVGQSFFEFINRRRVEEAKKFLADKNYQECTILAIAYDAGFNSKTAFNNAFKKYQGQTPSAYRNKKLK